MLSDLLCYLLWLRSQLQIFFTKLFPASPNLCFNGHNFNSNGFFFFFFPHKSSSIMQLVKNKLSRNARKLFAKE
jgi:hypothetical protein